MLDQLKGPGLGLGLGIWAAPWAALLPVVQGQVGRSVSYGLPGDVKNLLCVAKLPSSSCCCHQNGSQPPMCLFWCARKKPGAMLKDLPGGASVAPGAARNGSARAESEWEPLGDVHRPVDRPAGQALDGHPTRGSSKV